ncbi:Ig-like domain-containing protein [Pseudomonas brassicacearum]|uniref:Tc toxin subunit A n=1 Tax=Pseudomonas brassicacearum TaxID=930166 RepID=UPI0012951D45|nr:Tc toxin subunit A [Pseudomonas brassicacearum]QGA51772.1 virulence plasmid 28 protein [Pseudomonas brassicacearum]
MNASDNLPVHQLTRAVLGQERLAVLSGLNQYLAKNTSVFDLIKLKHAQLRALGLSRDEAQALLARGNALAVYVARFFREQAALGAANRRNEKALVGLPTYMNLFNPDIKGSAPAGAIENRASTTAYLVALREWVRDYIEGNGPEVIPLPLEMRRPDVDELLLNEMAVDRRLSRLEIANSVLEAQIKAKENIIDVKAFLRACRYHNSLPYDHDWESITHVVRTAIEDGSLGDVIRHVDLDYPYFKNPGAKGQRADVAQQLGIGIGPLHLSLLLESPYFRLRPDPTRTFMRVDPRTRLIDPAPQDYDFYRDNFGHLAVGLLSLRQLRIFSESTRLDQRGVDALLGRGAFTPELSVNAPALGEPGTPQTGVDAGAVYIHGGELPEIELRPDGIPQGTFMLHHVGETDNQERVMGHRMDRINRKCRLDRMLGLPSHQVDRLLVASMRAEYRGTGNGEFWIRSNTLRCLGLFKALSTRYDCQAEEFAAFIDVLSVHGQDGQLSQFDRVYNRHAMYDEPLLIDDGEFSIAPRSEADGRTVHQICNALDINFETYRFLAMVIAGAYGLRTQLQRSLRILSSFWRLTHLARLVGMTPIEATALLQTMSDGEGLVALLAGEPVVTIHGMEDGADALSAIQGLVDCALWAQDYDLSVLWLVRYVNPVHVPAVWTEGQEQFLRQLRSQVLAVRVLEASLLEEGAPPRIEWLPLLQNENLVDGEGLVLGWHDETEAQYLARTHETVRKIVEEAITEPESREPLQDLIMTLLLRCRDEQRTVVEEGVSVFLKLDSLLAAQIMRWSQGHAYDFLQKAMELSELQSPLARRQQEPEPFLKMLAELERRGEIAVRLGLSPQMLDTLLTGEQYQWFSLEGRYEITLQTVYYLALYSRIVSRVREPEEKMLDYLRQVNELPDDMSEDGMRLVRDAAADKLATYLGCGIKHVLECVQHIQAQLGEDDAPVKPMLSNLAQLDVLLRTLELAKKGMDATAAFSMGSLDPLDSDAAFAAAARNALESLTQFNSATGVPDSAEVGQSVTTRCLVDNSRLIANVPEEVAEFECTLLDFYGEPLKGVDVYWATDLGAILTPQTRTDDQGRARAQLQSGGRMGTAHVSFNIPLHEPIYGPSVVIDCDEDTLVVNPRSQWPISGSVPPILAGLRGEQELRVRMYDRYGNPGALRKVEWFTTLGQIRPNESYTDKDGWSRVWISSQQAGSATIKVTKENGEGFDFTYQPEFVDKPRILDNPYAFSVALVGQPLSLRCLVVGLGGEPVEGQEVSWWTSLDPESKTEEPSDGQGISQFTLDSPPAGQLTVFAQLENGPQVELPVWVASTAVIQRHSVDKQHSVQGGKPRLLWVDVTEPVEGSPRPLANYPVQWTLVAESPKGAVLETVSIATDAQGRSGYLFNPQTEGNFSLTARLAFDDEQSHEFKLSVIRAFVWKVDLLLLEDDEEPVPILPGLGELNLFRNARYRLEISADVPETLAGSEGAVGWSSNYTTQALAVTFNPPLATRITFEQDQPLFVEIRTGDVRNGRFQLSLVCDRLTEALVLNGTLSRRP